MTIDPLFVDLFAGDGRGPDLVHRLASFGAPWHGVWFKATEGVNYYEPSWFSPVWRAAHGFSCAHVRGRLGRDWWVSAYHYFLAHQDPIAQADLFLREVRNAGGWTRGTMYPVVDVEEGNQHSSTSAQQIIDGVSRFVERVREVSEREVILYAGWWLREKFREAGMRDRMGCRYVWPAAYTPTLDPGSYTDLGFDAASLFAWQYNGDGDGLLKGYPQTTPLGPEDISAITIAGGGDAALEHLRSQLWQIVD